MPARGARRRWRLASAAAVLGAVASLFIVVALHVLVAQGQLELERLSQELETEQRRYERARLAVAEAASPAAIVVAARDLGLVEPDEVTYLRAPDLPREVPAETDSTASTLADSWRTGKAILGADR